MTRGNDSKRRLKEVGGADAVTPGQGAAGQEGTGRGCHGQPAHGVVSVCG